MLSSSRFGMEECSNLEHDRILSLAFVHHFLGQQIHHTAPELTSNLNNSPGAPY